MQDAAGLVVWTAISSDGVQFLYESENVSLFAPITLDDGLFHDFRVVTNAGGYRLFIDDVLILDESVRTVSRTFEARYDPNGIPESRTLASREGIQR